MQNTPLADQLMDVDDEQSFKLQNLEGSCTCGSERCRNYDLPRLLDEYLEPNLNLLHRQVDPKQIWSLLSYGQPNVETFLHSLNEYKSQRHCVAVWPTGQVAYRCRTCSKMSTVALCVDCFRAGDHRDHDYNIFKSRSGGACDCGYDVVMKSGHCTKHGPNVVAPKSNEQIPDELICIPRRALPRIINRLANELRRFNITHLPPETHKYIDCLIEIANSSAVLRDLMIETLISPDIYTNQLELLSNHRDELIATSQRRNLERLAMHRAGLKPLTVPASYRDESDDRLIENFCDIPPLATFIDEFMFWTVKFEFDQKLVNFMIGFLMSDTYKELFSEIFVNYYPYIMLGLVGGAGRKYTPDLQEHMSRRILQISAQIFIDRDLTMKLCAKDSALQKTIYSLRMAIEGSAHYGVEGALKMNPLCLHGTERPKVVTCDSMIIRERKLESFFEGLNAILSFKEGTQLLLEDRKLLNTWLEMLSYFQTMSPYKRELTEHTPYETGPHISIFTVEAEYCMIPLWVILDHLKKLDSADHLSTLFLVGLHQTLSKWFSRMSISPTSQLDAYFMSFHIPLHRMAAAVIRHLIYVQGKTMRDLEDIYIRSVSAADQSEHEEQKICASMMTFKGMCRMLILHPLQALTLYHQIRCNMWTRNGLMTVNQAITYVHSSYSYSTIDLDMFLLRFCATQLDPNYFLKSLLQRFYAWHCLSFFSGPVFSHTPDERLRVHYFFNIQPEQLTQMVESCLITLIQLFNLNIHCDIDEREQIKQELISLISVADRSYSYLIETLPEKSMAADQQRVDEHFISVLNDLTVHKPAQHSGSNLQQACYTLKPEVWDSGYDPIYVLYRYYQRREYQVSLERFYQHSRSTGKLDRRHSSALWPPLMVPKSIGVFGEIDLSKLVACASIAGLVHSIIYKSLYVEEVADSMMAYTIHLLELSIRKCLANKLSRIIADDDKKTDGEEDGKREAAELSGAFSGKFCYRQLLASEESYEQQPPALGCRRDELELRGGGLFWSQNDAKMEMDSDDVKLFPVVENALDLAFDSTWYPFKSMVENCSVYIGNVHSLPKEEFNSLLQCNRNSTLQSDPSGRGQGQANPRASRDDYQSQAGHEPRAWRAQYWDETMDLMPDDLAVANGLEMATEEEDEEEEEEENNDHDDADQWTEDGGEETGANSNDNSNVFAGESYDVVSSELDDDDDDEQRGGATSSFDRYNNGQNSESSSWSTHRTNDNDSSSSPRPLIDTRSDSAATQTTAVALQGQDEWATTRSQFLSVLNNHNNDPAISADINNRSRVPEAEYGLIRPFFYFQSGYEAAIRLQQQQQQQTNAAAAATHRVQEQQADESSGRNINHQEAAPATNSTPVVDLSGVEGQPSECAAAAAADHSAPPPVETQLGANESGRRVELRRPPPLAPPVASSASDGHAQPENLVTERRAILASEPRLMITNSVRPLALEASTGVVATAAAAASSSSSSSSSSSGSTRSSSVQTAALMSAVSPPDEQVFPYVASMRDEPMRQHRRRQLQDRISAEIQAATTSGAGGRILSELDIEARFLGFFQPRASPQAARLMPPVYRPRARRLGRRPPLVRAHAIDNQPSGSQADNFSASFRRRTEPADERQQQQQQPAANSQSNNEPTDANRRQVIESSNLLNRFFRAAPQPQQPQQSQQQRRQQQQQRRHNESSRTRAKLRKEYRQHQGESILTLLLRLHSKYSQRRRAYKYDDKRARENADWRTRCRLGDGVHFITIILDLICLCDGGASGRTLARLEHLQELIWPDKNWLGAAESVGTNEEKAQAGGSKVARGSHTAGGSVRADMKLPLLSHCSSSSSSPFASSSAGERNFNQRPSGQPRGQSIGGGGGASKFAVAANLTLEQRRQLAKERQRRLMAEFANKQRDFLEKYEAAAGGSGGGGGASTSTSTKLQRAGADKRPAGEHGNCSAAEQLLQQASGEPINLSSKPRHENTIQMTGCDKRTSPLALAHHEQESRQQLTYSAENDKAPPPATTRVEPLEAAPTSSSAAAAAAAASSPSSHAANRPPEARANERRQRGAAADDEDKDDEGNKYDGAASTVANTVNSVGGPTKCFVPSPAPLEEQRWPVGVTNRSQTTTTTTTRERVRVPENNIECCICGLSEAGNALANPLGLVVLLQSSSVLGHAHLRQRSERRLPCAEWELAQLKELTYAKYLERRIDLLSEHFAESSWLDSINIGAEGGVHVQSCGHYLHIKCHQSYIRSLDQEDRLRSRNDTDEFLCPVCRQLANSVLPILSRAAEMMRASSSCSCSTSELVDCYADGRLLDQNIRLVASRLQQRQQPNQKELQSSAAFCSHLTKATAPQYRLVRSTANMHSLFLFLSSIARTNLETGLIARSLLPRHGKGRDISHDQADDSARDNDGSQRQPGNRSSKVPLCTDVGGPSGRLMDEAESSSSSSGGANSRDHLSLSLSHNHNQRHCHREATRNAEGQYSCFQLLFHVLALNAQTLINDQWFAGAQIWTQLSHHVEEIHRLSIKPANGSEVPLLLRDPVAILLQLLFAISSGGGGSSSARAACHLDQFRCLVGIIFNLTVIQSTGLVLSHLRRGGAEFQFADDSEPTDTQTEAEQPMSLEKEHETLGAAEQSDGGGGRQIEVETNELNEFANLVSCVRRSLSSILAPSIEAPLMNSIVRSAWRNSGQEEAEATPEDDDDSIWPNDNSPAANHNDGRKQQGARQAAARRLELVAGKVQLACLPYLRAAAYLQEHLYGRNLGHLHADADDSFHSNPKAIGQDFCALAQCLGLLAAAAGEEPTQRHHRDNNNNSAHHQLTRALNWPPNSGPNGRRLIASWATELLEFGREFSIGARSLFLCRPLAWFRPSLMRLPRDFHDIYMFYYRNKCSLCQQVPKDVAVCLVCGAPICFRVSCCKDRSRSRQAHSQHCGANTALFLAVHTSSIVIIRANRACVWGSVYLDAHGEEDNGLQRGRPLYLVEQRFALLESQWLAHSFDHSCVKRWVYLQEGQ